MYKHIIDHNTLETFRNRLLNFGKGNALFQLNDRAWLTIDVDTDTLPVNKALKKIHRKGKQYLKSTGIPPWKLTHGVLHWWDKRKQEAVTSPLLLKNGVLENVKGPEELLRFAESGEWFINPLIRYYFDEVYGVQLEKQPESLESVKAAIEEIIKGLQWNDDKDIQALIWKMEETSGIGLFNTGSYAFLHDYSVLLKDNIDPEVELKLEVPDSTPAFIQRPDPSQLEGLKAVSSGHSLQITGPPGTGKSSLITNLISDALLKQQKVLFVSEKKTALDVVYAKMNDQGLGAFCSFYHHSQSPTLWIKALNDSFEWMKDRKLSKNSDQLEQLTQKLELQKDFFRQYAEVVEEEVKGTGQQVGELILSLKDGSEKKNEELLKAIQQENISSILLTEHEELLKRMESQLQTLHELNVQNLIKPAFFREQKEPGKALDKMVGNIESGLNRLLEEFGDAKNVPNLPFLKELTLVATQLSHHYRAYQEILKNSTAEERFLKWGHEVVALQEQVEEQRKVLKAPEQLPSPSEIEDIRQQVQLPPKWYQFGKKKHLGKIQLNGFESKKAQLDYLDRLLVFREKELQLSEKKSRLFSRYALNISMAELGMMLSGVERMNRHHKAARWLVHQAKAAEYREVLGKLDGLIEQTYRSVLNLWGSGALKLSMEELLEQAAATKKLIPALQTLEPQIQQLPTNDRSVILLLAKSGTTESLRQHVHQYLLDKHLNYRPVFTGTSKKVYAEKVASFNRLVKEYADAVQGSIIDRQVSRVHDFLQLTDQYARETQKELKPLRKQLQQGKRKLFHEFSKTKRHLSPFEMLESEAQQWIQTLQPVWIMNTLSVSESLPLEKDLFDLVIFDESSQIPVEHAIPALYRAKRVVVVGDEQQMPPSKFFASTIEEDDEKEVSLMQYFKPVLNEQVLQWHYRSQHPRLIAFSNQNFYQNRLIPLPGKANSLQPVQHTFVKEGRFIDRKNEVEAKALVNALKQLKIVKDTLAVVCFSEEQAALVEKQLPENDQIQVMSLEQVQGEEYDRVWISLAYGKNEEGQFRYYLGPLNRAEGPRRLNVLMSRARKSMHLFHSVMPEDFTGRYENPGVDMLYRMLQFFLEDHSHSAQEMDYPEPLGKLEKEGEKIMGSDQYGHYSLVANEPLNEGFVQHLFGEMGVDFEFTQKIS